MSLKAFHIVFILAATALCVGFGFWGLGEYLRARSLQGLLMGGGSFLASLALVWYGIWFLRKYKDFSYL